MSGPTRLSDAQLRIWRTYRAAGVLLAAVNGVYGAYAFIYLKRRLESAGGESATVLDNLLFVIIGSMLFEFVAEPITGDWADSFGRRRMVVSTYLGVCLAFVAYWVISADAVSNLGAATQVRLIVALALIAEVFYAVASALFNGALDAWFVDEMRIAHGPQGRALLPLFAVQRRWAGLFMVAGGVIALWVADATFHVDSRTTAGGLLSAGALPWLAAAVIMAAAALWLGVSMAEHRVPVRGDEPSHLRIWLRLKRTLSMRDLRNALLVSSVLYTCWICFMYLLPVLLTEKRIVADAGALASVLKGYYWYYLAMGTSRFLGPYLSGRLWPEMSPMVRFRWWGVLNCGALAMAGLALLGRRWDVTDLNAVLVPAALVLFWVAKLAEEAFKPVRSTYLNYLMVDGTDRAFVLSMATPFGAIIVVIGVGMLAGLQQLFSALDEVSMSVPLLFAILGLLGVGLTIKLSRAGQPVAAGVERESRSA
jgi:MFS family permease